MKKNLLIIFLVTLSFVFINSATYGFEGGGCPPSEYFSGDEVLHLPCVAVNGNEMNKYWAEVHVPFSDIEGLGTEVDNCMGGTSFYETSSMFLKIPCLLIDGVDFLDGVNLTGPFEVLDKGRVEDDHGGGDQCPPDRPVKCDNGRCEADESMCGDTGGGDKCPPDRPVKCDNGRCEADESMCGDTGGGDQCPTDMPVMCDDGSCVSDASECATDDTGGDDNCDPEFGCT